MGRLFELAALGDGGKPRAKGGRAIEDLKNVNAKSSPYEISSIERALVCENGRKRGFAGRNCSVLRFGRLGWQFADRSAPQKIRR